MGKHSNNFTYKLLVIFTFFHCGLFETNAMDSNFTTATVLTYETNYVKYNLLVLNSTKSTLSNEPDTFSENTDFITDYSTKNKVYTWNKAELSALNFQQSYCAKRCDNGKAVFMFIVDTTCQDIVCFHCKCKRPECEIYGICCPDISETYFPPPDTDETIAVDHGQSYWNNKENNVQQDNKSEIVKTTNVSTFQNTLHDGDKTGTSATHKHFNGSNIDSFNKRQDDHQEKYPSSNAQGLQQEQRPQQDNQHVKLECETDSRSLYIRSCSPDVKVSADVLKKCESGVPVEELTVNNVILVTDNTTHVVYYNRFCAECNDVSQYVKWNVNVQCMNYLHVYPATSMDQLIILSSDPLSTCQVHQMPPEGFEPIPCDDMWYRPDVVDTCNVTGLWRDYDEDVVMSCAKLKAQTYKVVKQQPNADNGYEIFQNIFCAICNQESYPKHSTFCGTSRSSIPEQPLAQFDKISPLSMLFNVRKIPPRSDVTPQAKNCRSLEWASPNGTCVPVKCYPGKLLNNNSCSTALEQITGLGYRFQLWFYPHFGNATAEIYLTDILPTGVVLRQFYKKILDVLNPLVEDIELTVGVTINISIMNGLPTTETSFPTTDGDYKYHFFSTSTPSLVTSPSTETSQKYTLQPPLMYWLTGLALAKRLISRDQFEGAIIDTLLSTDIQVDFGEDVAVNFTPSVMLPGTNISDYCTQIHEANSDIACYNVSLVAYGAYYMPSYISYQDLFLQVTDVLTCRFVSFQESLYEIEVIVKDIRPINRVKLSIGEITLILTNSFELRMLDVGRNGSLHICRDILDQKLSQIGQPTAVTEVIKTVQYYLTLVCLGVSMLCLLWTVVTYAMFAALRSVAGRNNMCLSASLLLAQSSLLASYHTRSDSTFCLPLGVVTHFLWLCMFVWSFICCFYMYKVFGAKTRSSYTTSRSQTALMIKNIIFSLLVPSIIVVAVVVAVYITSGGDDVGYGGTVCYLNSPWLVGGAMIGPLVVVLACNTAFFVVTVCNIYSISKLQAQDTRKKDGHQNIYVYVKLSTITGAFWITFIVAEISDVDSLRIITVILNGLQGVFIMLSYVCNKRVLALYLRTLGIKKSRTSFTASATESSMLGKQSPKKSENIGLENKTISIYSVADDNSKINSK